MSLGAVAASYVATPPPPSLTLVGSRRTGGAGGTGTLNVLFPVGTQAGDLVVIQDGCSSALGNPAGWNRTYYDPGSWFRGATFWKFVTAGEVTTGYVTISAGTTDGHIAVATTVRGATAVATVHGACLGYGGDPAEAVAVPAGAGLLLYAMHVRNWSTVASIDRGTLQQNFTGGFVNGQTKSENADAAVTVNFTATGSLEGTFRSVLRVT